MEDVGVASIVSASEDESVALGDVESEEVCGR